MERPADRTPPRPRFWNQLQPTIVKLYKLAGLLALSAILVGLISFLVVNVFYFFDNTWVRPVVLSPTHQKVIEASTQLGDAKLHQATLKTEKLDIEAQLAEIDRVVSANDKFLAELAADPATAPFVNPPAQAPVPPAGAGSAAPAPTVTPPKASLTPEQWMIVREISRARLERDNALGKRTPLMERQAGIAAREEEQTALVGRLSESPYLRARDKKVVVAFVPYQNLKNVKKDTKLYSCSWGIVACSKVGKITMVLEGEVTDIHPHNESAQRGVMVVIEVSESAANDNVLFAGGKPLWLF